MEAKLEAVRVLLNALLVKTSPPDTACSDSGEDDSQSGHSRKQDVIAGHVDGETLLTAIKDTDGIKKITDTVSTDMTSRFDTIKAAPVVGVKTVTTSAARSLRVLRD